MRRRLPVVGQRGDAGARIDGVTWEAEGVVHDISPDRGWVTTIEAAHERLAGGGVECLDWSVFIDRYDRPETLFHLDPPCWGSEHYCGRDPFGRKQFELIAARLRGVQGRFILSINDTPEVWDVFSAFAMESAELMYGVGGGGRTRAARELIVSGP